MGFRPYASRVRALRSPSSHRRTSSATLGQPRPGCSDRPRAPDQGQRQSRGTGTRECTVTAALATVAVAGLVAIWWLLAMAEGGSRQDRIDAIRTGPGRRWRRRCRVGAAAGRPPPAARCGRMASNTRPSSARRSRSMSSKQSAPATLPASSDITFATGFAPALFAAPAIATCSATSPRQTDPLGQRDHRHQPGINDRIRIIERDSHHRRGVGRLHLAVLPQPRRQIPRQDPSSQVRQHPRPHSHPLTQIPPVADPS